MHIIYYGSNIPKAKEMAAECRAIKLHTSLRHAVMFDEPEPIDAVTLLDCVSDYDRARIIAAYPDIAITALDAKPAKPGKPVVVEPVKIQTVEIDKSAAPARVDPIEGARRDVIDIPQNWQGLPFMTKRGIARNIANDSGPSIAVEVDTVIAAEVARREAKG